MFIRQIIGIVENSKKILAYYTFLVCDLDFTIHLDGLRPRVYYTLTNFRGGGKAPLPPPLNTPMDKVGSYCS